MKGNMKLNSKDYAEVSSIFTDRLDEIIAHIDERLKEDELDNIKDVAYTLIEVTKFATIIKDRLIYTKSMEVQQENDIAEEMAEMSDENEEESE